MIQKFYDEVNKIKDEEIRAFTKICLDNAPEQFWHDPCSGTGKYHPPEDQGEGGLIRHLIKCNEIAKSLCYYYNLSPLQTDICSSATILHDIQKNGIPWGLSTSPDHGKFGAEFISQFNLRDSKKIIILNCVRYHMGRWTPEPDLNRALNPTALENIVQLSDFFGSRKYASFLPEISLSQETIDSYLKNS